MKTSSPSPFWGVTLALWLTLALPLAAQDATTPANQQTPSENRAPTENSPATTAPATDAPAAPADPAAPAAPTAPAAPADEAARPASPDTPEAPPLRDLGQAEPSAPSSPARRPVRRSVQTRSSADFPFGDHLVAAGNHAHEVVSIFGSSTIEGEVSRDAVSVFGATLIGPEAKIGGAAVAVFGGLMTDGEVRNEAVAVFGHSRINGRVGNEAVCVFGNMELGPKAVIDGDVVVVGGKLTRHPSAVIHGNEVRVPVLGGLVNIDWLTTWVKRCLLMGRPLAFGENLGWAWAIALSFLAFYLLLALIFPRGIEKCVLTLETRPGSTVLASVLTVLLTPVAIILLAVTVVGALLIPFVSAGLILAGLFGKAVMLAWIGRRVTGSFEGRSSQAVLAVLIGGVIVLLLYVVPLFGFLLFKVLGWLGLGVVVYTILLANKREKPSPPPAPAGSPTPLDPNAPAPAPAMSMDPAMPAAAPAPMPPAGGATSAGFVGGSAVPLAGDPSPGAVGFVSPPIGAAPAAAAAMPTTFGPAAVPPPPPVAPRPPAPPLGTFAATTLPRASLWIRLGALFLDVVLIALLVNLINNMLPFRIRFDVDPPAFLPWLAIYGAIMWKIKGTTIGGIVCGLKVVRTDGREIDWPTAVVRALGCFLSLFVAGLGFIWIAIDNDRQSWHDKIAGTAVVRVPKGVPLV